VGEILQALIGLVSLAALAALPIVFVFWISRNPLVRGLAVAIVLSPTTTFLLGCAIGGIRYGANRGRGLYPQVFTERFIGFSIVLSFFAWWVVSALFLERRAGKATTPAAPAPNADAEHSQH
jgi:hypothetical protein